VAAQLHSDRQAATTRGTTPVCLASLAAVTEVRLTAVGFRWWARARALELGLAGSATNLEDGRVQVVAEGPRQACDRLLAALRAVGAPGRVDFVAERWSSPRGETGFVER